MFYKDGKSCNQTFSDLGTGTGSVNFSMTDLNCADGGITWCQGIFSYMYTSCKIDHEFRSAIWNTDCGTSVITTPLPDEDDNIDVKAIAAPNAVEAPHNVARDEGDVSLLCNYGGRASANINMIGQFASFFCMDHDKEELQQDVRLSPWASYHDMY